jgi:Rrf2 family protein
MLSQKTRYTIRALQHLADHWRRGPVRLDAIASAQNIPRKFLTVILSEMVREGLVISHRGREGGYELALAPVDVRYGDIIRLTRGSLALVPCASRYAHEHCANCLPEADCRLRGLMLALRDEMAAMLDKVTLADPIALEPPYSDDETLQSDRLTADSPPAG